ncbi:hypothetical protein GTH52_01380 [Clostridium tyrobutyricum]|nr:hypothetical protein [Clostridium tyrobutyricum]MBV4434382.1 hypothetical protein [Clostridium tyrobutyricum]MBV4450225.1 hypothetical protein [Clostridium tyrobutyricum]QNB68093.1 hypothetical protein GTH52_01380 [Clostridium tyrobutyricum]
MLADNNAAEASIREFFIGKHNCGI